MLLTGRIRAKSIILDHKQICEHFIQWRVLLILVVEPLDVINLGPQTKNDIGVGNGQCDGITSRVSANAENQTKRKT